VYSAKSRTLLIISGASKQNQSAGGSKWIINRLLSFSMIITIGFLLVVSLIVSALMDVLSIRLQAYFQFEIVEVFYVLNLLMVFTVITILFTTIFKNTSRWPGAVVRRPEGSGLYSGVIYGR
jgi:uncharacterized BrkB/YihY/UPF0761 family membrane protein